MPNYPYTFQLPPLNVQDIPNDGVAGEFLGINGSGVLDWLTAGGGGTGDMLKADNLSGLASYPTARTNLGLGTGDTPTFANLTLTSPSLSSSAPVTISQTWGTTGTYTAFKVVANETATAAAASNLLELWSGSTAALKLSIGKGGSIFSKVGVITPSGTANAAGLSLQLFFPGCGLGIDNNGSTQFLIDGTAKTRCGLGVVVASDQAIAWSSTTHTGLGVASDTILVRDGAANTLALRNGAAAQTFNVYGTWTSITDYRRLTISCDNTTGNATITANKGSATTGDVGTVSINGVPVGLRGGSFSIGIGANAILSTSTGTQNTGVGVNALSSNTSGAYNSGFGTNTLSQNTSGSNNIAAGSFAGNFITGGATANAISNNSVYLGVESRANASNETNQIVIGYQATGIGSNSVVLGNDSITNTALKGNVGIGTTSPTSKLHVEETWNSPTVAVTSATGTGTIATVNFASSAVIPVGTRVTVAGVSPSQYNGTYVVTASSATSVSYANTTTISATAGGTVQRAFAAMKVVATDTSSAGESNLLEFWSGSTPALKGYVAKSGSFVGGAVGINEMPALSFPNNGSYSVGIYQPGSYKIQFSMGSGGPGAGASAAYSGLQYEMTSGVLSWGTTAQDIVLLRDGEADHLALRRSTNGQKFSVYGTYPGAAWERFTITAPTSGNVLLGTYKGTGGIARGLEFQTDGVTRMTINAAGTSVIFPSGIGLQRTDGGGAIFDFTYNGVQFSNTDGLGVSWSTITGPASSKHVGVYGYASEPGVVQVNSSVKGTLRDLRCRSVIEQPPASITPALNGDLVVEATSNTTLTFKLKGTDGTVRSGTITLSV